MENTVLFKKTLQIEYTLQIRDIANLDLYYLLGNCTYLALGLQDPILPFEIRKCLHRSDFTVLFKDVSGLFSCVAQCLKEESAFWGLWMYHKMYTC